MALLAGLSVAAVGQPAGRLPVSPSPSEAPTVVERFQVLPPAPWPVWTSAAVAVPASITGNTYYVDGVYGKDTNDGRSLASAFATVKKGVSKVAAGDTVLIRAGLYREGIDLNGVPSGTAAKPITFGSYGDGEVILDGSTKVSGWTQVSGSIWRAPVGFTPIGVVLNDVPLKQTPDGASAVTAGSGKWFYDAAGKTITADVGSVNPNSADIVVPNNNGAQYHVYFYGDYYTFKGLTIRGSGSAGIWGYGNHVTVERSDIKFNGKSAVSFMAGYADNAVLYSHIYQNTLLNWPRGNNGFAQAGGGWSGGIAWSGNLRPLARGNIVHMNGGEGVISYGTWAGKPSGSALFEQNVVYDNWSVNMYFDNQPNDIARNNIIYNHPVDTSTWLYNTNVWPWNELYKYNTCLMLADEENSSDATNNYANLSGSQVYNNLLANCRVAIRDYSEGADSINYHGLKNTLIANNTIILPAVPLPNTSTMGIFLQDNTTPSGVNRNVNSVIQNNIIYGFGNAPLIWIQSQKALSGVAMSNNVYFSAYATPFSIGYDSVQYVNFATWLSMTGVDSLSLFQNPSLVNVTAFQAPGTAPYDYANANLSSVSAARGMGKTQSVFNNNLPGAVRSVWNGGAF
jgi:hypothetical protein